MRLLLQGSKGQVRVPQASMRSIAVRISPHIGRSSVAVHRSTLSPLVSFCGTADAGSPPPSTAATPSTEQQPTSTLSLDDLLAQELMDGIKSRARRRRVHDFPSPRELLRVTAELVSDSTAEEDATARLQSHFAQLPSHSPATQCAVFARLIQSAAGSTPQVYAKKVFRIATRLDRVDNQVRLALVNRLLEPQKGADPLSPVDIAAALQQLDMVRHNIRAANPQAPLSRSIVERGFALALRSCATVLSRHTEACNGRLSSVVAWDVGWRFRSNEQPKWYPEKFNRKQGDDPFLDHLVALRSDTEVANPSRCPVAVLDSAAALNSLASWISEGVEGASDDELRFRAPLIQQVVYELGRMLLLFPEAEPLLRESLTSLKKVSRGRDQVICQPMIEVFAFYEKVGRQLGRSAPDDKCLPFYNKDKRGFAQLFKKTGYRAVSYGSDAGIEHGEVTLAAVERVLESCSVSIDALNSVVTSATKAHQTALACVAEAAYSPIGRLHRWTAVTVLHSLLDNFAKLEPVLSPGLRWRLAYLAFEENHFDFGMRLLEKDFKKAINPELRSRVCCALLDAGVRLRRHDALIEFVSKHGHLVDNDHWKESMIPLIQMLLKGERHNDALSLLRKKMTAEKRFIDMLGTGKVVQMISDAVVFLKKFSDKKRTTDDYAEPVKFVGFLLQELNERDAKVTSIHNLSELARLLAFAGHTQEAVNVLISLLRLPHPEGPEVRLRLVQQALGSSLGNAFAQMSPDRLDNMLKVLADLNAAGLSKPGAHLVSSIIDVMANNGDVRQALTLCDQQMNAGDPVFPGVLRKVLSKCWTERNSEMGHVGTEARREYKTQLLRVLVSMEPVKVDSQCIAAAVLAWDEKELYSDAVVRVAAAWKVLNDAGIGKGFSDNVLTQFLRYCETPEDVLEVIGTVTRPPLAFRRGGEEMFANLKSHALKRGVNFALWRAAEIEAPPTLLHSVISKDELLRWLSQANPNVEALAHLNIADLRRKVDQDEVQMLIQLNMMRDATPEQTLTPEQEQEWRAKVQLAVENGYVAPAEWGDHNLVDDLKIGTEESII